MSHIVYKDGWIVLPKDVDDSTTVSEDIPNTGSLAFDFQFLRNLNSYGIRLLIQLFRTHSHQDLEFHRCPYQIISIINVVRDLLGPARDGRIVKSLELPYGCDSCRQLKSSIVKTSDIDPHTPGYGHPEPDCPSCGEPMELEVDETEYLKFLQ